MGMLSCRCTKLLLHAAVYMFATAESGALVRVWKLTEHVWLLCCLGEGGLCQPSQGCFTITLLPLLQVVRNMLWQGCCSPFGLEVVLNMQPGCCQTSGAMLGPAA